MRKIIKYTILVVILVLLSLLAIYHNTYLPVLLNWTFFVKPNGLKEAGISSVMARKGGMKSTGCHLPALKTS